MFPGYGAQIYRNDAGEPLGWDYPDDGPADPEDHYREEERWDAIAMWMDDTLVGFEGTREDARALLLEEFETAPWWNRRDAEIVRRGIGGALDQWEDERG